MGNEILDAIKSDGITAEEAQLVVNILEGVEDSFDLLSKTYHDDKEKYHRMKAIELSLEKSDEKHQHHLKVCPECSAFLECFPKMEEAYQEDIKRNQLYVSVREKLKKMIVT